MAGNGGGIKSVGRVLGAAVGGGIGLGIAGLVVGIVLDIVGIQIMDSSSYHLFVWGLIGGAVLGAIIAMGTGAAEARSAAQAESRSRDDARRAAEQSRAAGLRSAVDQAGAACHRAIDAFVQLPQDVERARTCGLEAARHRRNGAFSPFWHAIEQSYAALGEYNARVREIGSASATYVGAVAAYRSSGGDGTIAPFPVSLDDAAATKVAAEVVAGLDAMVYDAQTDAVFAQIWEQRRTTAAVVRGFANLEAAVHEMRSSLDGSIASLGVAIGSLDGSLGQVRVAVEQVGATGAAQLGAQRQLSEKVTKATWYLQQEHVRATGRWWE